MTKIAVTLPEAVELSGIGRTKLYELFKAGTLKPRKVGTRIRSRGQAPAGGAGRGPGRDGRGRNAPCQNVAEAAGLV